MSGKVLLLDVLDTLVQDPFPKAVSDLFGLDLPAYFSIKDKENYLAFERGEISLETYGANLFVDKRPVDVEALKTRYRSGYAWMEGMEDVLRDLRDLGVEMHAMSNYSELFEVIDEELGLSRYLTWSLVSCRTGRRKPDREAFVTAGRLLGRPPEEMVLVDDREKNCAAARAAGLGAIVFEGSGALRASLAARGIPLD